MARFPLERRWDVPSRASPLLGKERAGQFTQKLNLLNVSRGSLEALKATPNELNRLNIQVNQDGIRRSAFELMRYDHIGFKGVATIWPELSSIPDNIRDQLSIEAMYANYLGRQTEDMEQLKNESGMIIPDNLNLDDLPSLSNEVKAKLRDHQPTTIGGALSIQGITPAAVISLMAHIRKLNNEKRHGKKVA